MIGDGLAVDQDRVRRTFDLGLLVAQLGDEAVGVVGADAAGQGKQWVEVELQDLHHAAAGLGEQQQHPLGLLIARSAVADVAAQLAGDRQDAGHDRVLDDLFLVGGSGAGPGPLAGLIEPAVLDTERQPAVVPDRARQIGTVVEQPPVEVLGLVEVLVGRRLRQWAARALGSHRSDLAAPTEDQIA